MGRMKDLHITIHNGGDEAVAAVERIGKEWREQLEQAASEIESLRTRSRLPSVDCLPYPTGYNRGMAKKIDPDEYIRIGTAAAIAGVTRAYINRLIANGRFPAICIDGQNFVRRADAEKFANPPKN